MLWVQENIVSNNDSICFGGMFTVFLVCGWGRASMFYRILVMVREQLEGDGTLYHLGPGD